MTNETALKFSRPTRGPSRNDKIDAPRRTRLLAGLMLAVALAPISGYAQTYPSKLVRIVVPYAAGGGTDTVARLIGPRLSEALGQPVIIENRPGASTNIASEQVAKSPPDGYTLLLQAPNLATNEALFSGIGWSPRDFVGVIQLVRYSNVLVAGPSTKLAGFKDLLAQSKSDPKAFSYGTPGAGSLSHLSTELLKVRTGLNAQHISYKGSAPIMNDLLGGHLPIATDNLNSQLPNIRSGKVKPIVVLSSRRDPAAPEIPSLGDMGVNDVEGGGWYGIVAPASTPAPVVARLNAEIQKILEVPSVRERITTMGLEVVGGPSDEFTRHIAAETRKWSEVIRKANIKVGE